MCGLCCIERKMRSIYRQCREGVYNEISWEQTQEYFSATPTVDSWRILATPPAGQWSVYSTVISASPPHILQPQKMFAEILRKTQRKQETIIDRENAGRNPIIFFCFPSFIYCYDSSYEHYNAWIVIVLQFSFRYSSTSYKPLSSWLIFLCSPHARESSQTLR